MAWAKSPLSLVVLASILSIQSEHTYAHDDAIEEIVVTTSRIQRSLADTPLRVQILGEGELREKANMKPGDIRMMLNESTGIQVQQTSPTSFSSSIRIQGLDGRYTQMLRDGLPIYSGFSGSLSLLQIAPLDLAQVEVVKGASSTLYGGGAIAGLVNLVSKTPGHDPESAAMINLTSADGLDASFYHSREMGEHGMTLFTSYNRGDAYDAANNGLTDIPEFERVAITPRWFYELGDETKLDVGVGFIDESRLGGSLSYIDGSDTSHYFESNDSRRSYVRLGLSHHLANEAEIALKATGSWFDRTLTIQNHQFGGVQQSNFAELSYAHGNDQANWVMGVNLTSDQFDQEQGQAGFNHDYSEDTVGIFGQYTHDLSDHLVIEGGLRADSHSEYGEFLLPRLSLLMMPTHDLTLRLGGGYGYKVPNIFVADAEEIHFKDLAPLNPDLFEAETSRGVNFDINHRIDEHEHFSLTSNLLFFYTEIDKPVELSEQAGTYVFTQRDDTIDTTGVETNLIFGFGELRYFVGHTYVDVDLPLVSKNRLNQVLVWEREDDFRIGLEAYYFSPQKRENDTTGESYWILGLMTEKKLTDQVTAFLNFENFNDTRQTRFENINTGDLVNPIFRDIYAPMDGFVVNGGVRISW